MDGPSGVDDRVPEPHEDPRSPTPPTTSKVVIEWLGVLVPFTTVLTALAFWFTWLYSQRAGAFPRFTRNFETIGGFPDPQMK